MSGEQPRLLDAGTIAGLLADDDRRKVVAAVELGARTIDDIAQSTGLASMRVAKAAGRLAQAGLLADRDGALVVDAEAVRRAARNALSRPPSTEHDDLPGAARKVMAAFVNDGS